MDYAAPLSVIGIGSNAVRMLTARAVNGVLTDTKRYREDVRTFSGLTARGLSSEMMARVLMSVMRLRAAAISDNAAITGVIATSAARDAANVGELIQLIREGTGLETRALTGDEEARLGFAGVTAGHAGYSGMVDIGGGSTELAVGAAGDPSAQLSLQMGAARLANTTANAEPDAVLSSLESAITAARANLPNALPREWFGVGGTINALARVNAGGAADVEGAALTLDEVERLADKLRRMTLEQRGSTPGIPRSRAEIIVPGAWIALACMRSLGVGRITVTERGNLDGWLCLRQALTPPASRNP
ncbi:MAG: hypothetical protein LBS11_10735 [Oscillospiraceae bacterium]|jgi:exopolyphosphatase/guanosine-5'-triphosphate,3'-diphosphate pyrophosphatase|nr:hypothetical protein [Oscillospiraceae bacterium]